QQSGQQGSKDQQQQASNSKQRGSAEEQAEPESSAAQQPQSNDQELHEGEGMENLEQKLSEQAANQWLRKIPDDPGGLLRRKFLYQYQNRGGAPTEANPW
ncbi:MAG: hypothetical protein ACC663_05895, partial [Gammaproteobacteria bacterium]